MFRPRNLFKSKCLTIIAIKGGLLNRAIISNGINLDASGQYGFDSMSHSRCPEENGASPFAFDPKRNAILLTGGSKSGVDGIGFTSD
jgi:hypothetical protein